MKKVQITEKFEWMVPPFNLCDFICPRSAPSYCGVLATLSADQQVDLVDKRIVTSGKC